MGYSESALLFLIVFVTVIVYQITIGPLVAMIFQSLWESLLSKKSLVHRHTYKSRVLEGEHGEVQLIENYCAKCGKVFGQRTYFSG